MADEFMSMYLGDAVVTLLGLGERADSHNLARRQAAKSDPYAYVALPTANFFRLDWGRACGLR